MGQGGVCAVREGIEWRGRLVARSRSMLRFVATEKPEGVRDSRPVMGHTCSLTNPRSCALSEATNSPPYVARCGGVLGRRRALQTRLHRGPFDEKRRAWQPATVGALYFFVLFCSSFLCTSGSCQVL